MRSRLPKTREERVNDLAAGITFVLMLAVILGVVLGLVWWIENNRPKPKPEPVKPYRQMNWTVTT